jgi:hypothetical protein
VNEIFLASLGHRWRQHVTVRGFDEHCIATEVIGFRNTSYNHQSFKLIWSYHSVQTVQKKFTINVAFAMTISRAQGHALNLDGICPPSPGFFQCPSLYGIVPILVVWKCRCFIYLRASTKYRRWQTDNIQRISRSAWRFHVYMCIYIYLFIQCFIFSTRVLFSRLQLVISNCSIEYFEYSRIYRVYMFSEKRLI